MDQLLLIFSLAFIIVMLLMIVVPYWKQRRDLLCSWNLFLAGSAVFVGLSGHGAVSAPRGYIENAPADYYWFFAGVIAFYATAYLTYRYLKWPRRIADRVLKDSPPMHTGVLVLLVPLCFVMSLGMIFPIRVQGIAQFMMIVGRNGVILAMVFTLIVWWRQKLNPVMVYTLIGVLLLSLGFSMFGGTGRRDMVGVLATLPIVAYWCHYRYVRPGRTLIFVLILGTLGYLTINAYSGMRHSMRNDKSPAALMKAIVQLPSEMLDFSHSGQMLGQNAVEVSLLAINVYHTEQWPGYEYQPFHSMKFVLVNPMPRAFWPDKPEGLGRSLPRDTKLRGGRETWGPGIVGHGFHEGGLHILVCYGFILACVLRLFDELLVRHPASPYLLGILAATSGHIIGWPRGDIGTFTLQIIGGVIAGLLIRWFAKLVFGSQPTSVGWPAGTIVQN